MAQTVKRLSTKWETQVRSLGQEDPLEKEVYNEAKLTSSDKVSSELETTIHYKTEHKYSYQKPKFDILYSLLPFWLPAHCFVLDKYIYIDFVYFFLSSLLLTYSESSSGFPELVW